MRIDKDNYYLNIAKAVAARSTCLRRQYGAVIVADDEIIATGYNGRAQRRGQLLRRREVLLPRAFHSYRRACGSPRGPVRDLRCRSRRAECDYQRAEAVNARSYPLPCMPR